MRKLYVTITSYLLPFISFAQSGQISIDRVDQMPDLPAPYEMRDWKDVARKYDDFIYSMDMTGQYLPVVGLKTNSINYPSLQPIKLQSYVGGSTDAAESINIIPSIVGATLVGKDKSNQDGTNWVLKTKDFFNKANQQNIYLNGYSATSGNDWWYDVMPNVFFYQLYSQYPSDVDFQDQFIKVADRWLTAVYQMGGSTTPWTTPDMNYRGWYMATMKGNSSGVLEPESAGSIAWLLYQAFTKTGDKKYLDGAQMAMEFLSNLNSNPSYELQLPYGTLTAAKMNAEHGTGYNIDKMLNWSFDRGELRGWGTIVGTWDGNDVSGLIGEANDAGNDYAFAMNGFEQAAAFAPLMKYDKRYARAISKWILNLANASRLFYSKYLATDRQDDYTWSETYDPGSVIAYEALKEKNEYAADKPLYGTGDAKRNGWAATNLGLYGSSHVGYMAAVVESTDVDGILKLDVNATDFYGQNAYPTYAIYNPHSSAKQVTLSPGPGSYDIYDAISESNISAGVTGDIQISVPANQVILISYLPAGSSPVDEDGKLMIGDNVVDYHYGYDFDPDFRIKSITSKDKNFALGATATIYASVDNAPASTSYEWYVNDELVGTTSTGVFDWTTPGVEGSYTIVLKAKSGASEATGSIDLSVWEIVPTPPDITGMTKEKKFYYEGDDTQFTVNVEGDDLAYEWNAPGSYIAEGALLHWTAPGEGIYAISCTVTNNFDLQSSISLDVLVKKEQVGTTDPVAWYPFDGDTKDYSRHEYNAKSSGVKPAKDARGYDNSAWSFSSDTDIIYVPNKIFLDFTHAATLSFWIKAASVPGESFIISHGSWEERYKVSIIPNGKIRWTAKTSEATVDLDTSSPLALNEYHHVAVVYSGYSMEMYLDGELDTFTRHSGELQTTSKSVTFGRKDEAVTDYALKGTLDEVRIYDEGLSPVEIATLKTLWNSVPVDTITGLKSEVNLRPYPNPVSYGTFAMDISKTKINKLSITDLSGRETDYRIFDRGNKTEIRLSPDLHGLFIVKITTPEATSVFKMIVD